MKATLKIEADNADKLHLLIRVAEEMGIAIKATSEQDDLTAVSELSLATEWNSTEDDRWDEVYAHLKK